MPDLTRRGFLGSLLALPAAVLIPDPLFAAAQRIIIPDVRFVLTKPGQLVDLIFWYRPAPGTKPRDFHGTMEAIRLDGSPLITIGLNARATFRWVAAPGMEIPVSEKQPVIIYMERIPGHTGHIWTNLGGDDTSQMKI